MELFAGIPIPSKSNPQYGALLAGRVIWAAAFVLLVVLAVVNLISGGALLDLKAQWLVGQGLPAAAELVRPELFFSYLLTLRYAALAVFWLVALLIFWRQPDDWVALLVSWALLLNPFFSLALGEESPWQTLGSFLGLAFLVYLLFVFPDGRFLPQTSRSRILLVMIILLTPFISYVILSASLPHYAPDEQGYGAFLFTLGVIMLSGVSSQVYRYRNVADPSQRQQTRWVLFGLSFQLVWIGGWLLSITGLLAALGISASTQALIGLHINLFVPLLLPVTFGVAMLRHGLWSSTPLINRALVYGMLSVIIIILYIFVVGALGVLFQSRGSLLIALLATGVVAVAFQPLRSRLQQSVNRLMYGERDDPLGMLTRLTRQLERAGSTEAILPTFVETVATSLKLPYVAISLQQEEDITWEMVASFGVRQEQVVPIPLRYENQEIGLLEVGPRSAGEQLSEADQQILANIALLLTITIRALQLNEQLQNSRRHLVAAREEERRRIRRDLHDGLGPVLASLTLQTDTAMDLVHSDPDGALTILRKMRDKAQTAVADIRLLVHGLRPPALDELGLAGAIRQYVATLGPNDLTFTVDVPDDLPALPAAVEVAAYRIAQEAINNVASHAQSTSCTVRLLFDGQLSLEIIDDGVGLPVGGSHGIGLGSMSDRAAELGGTCVTESLPTGGVRVIARLPVTNLK